MGLGGEAGLRLTPRLELGLRSRLRLGSGSGLGPRSEVEMTFGVELWHEPGVGLAP